MKLPLTITGLVLILLLMVQVNYVRDLLPDPNTSTAQAISSQTVSVESGEELLMALEQATGGERLYVSAGIYDRIILSDYEFSTPVTIVAADYNAPPVVRYLEVVDSEGLVFDGLHFTNDTVDTDTSFQDRRSGAEYLLVNVYASENIVFTNNLFSGQSSTHPEFTGYSLGYGLRARDGSENLSIEHNEFTNLNKALWFADDIEGLVIKDNEFVDYRQDAIYFLDRPTDVLIAENTFVGIYPYTIRDDLDDDHADVVQSSRGLQNTVIRDNYINTGAGSVTQGFFLTGDGSNVTIENNLLYTNMWHAISPYQHTGIIRHNTVLWNRHYETAYPSGDGTTPRLQGGAGLMGYEYNVATAYRDFDPTDTTNIQIDYEDYGQYFVDATSDDKATLDSFALITSNPFTEDMVTPGIDMPRLKAALANVGRFGAAEEPEVEVSVADPDPEVVNLIPDARIVATIGTFRDAPENLSDGCLEAEVGCTAAVGTEERFGVTYDLGDIYKLKQVRLFGDTTGSWHSHHWRVESKRTKDEPYTVFFDDLNAFKDDWSVRNLNTTGRFIRLTVWGTPGNGTAQAREFELYGHELE